jgi:acetoin utilization deacetylase AcuC-like enzyme
MSTVYITHPRYAEHNLPGHPEHAGRIQAVWDVLGEADLVNRMNALQPLAATDEMILAVHTQDHLDLLKWTSTQDKIVMIDADTYVLPSSFEIARMASGGLARAVDAVLKGEADNGLAVVRPPGHHATPGRAMGFCLLNNIAIAAAYARHTHGLERVMIVDYDIHHGNGTQDIFYADEHVLFISTHQYHFYPGTGAMSETGTGTGDGYTINIPLQAGHGDASYRRVFEEIVWPAARRFKPQLILVSAGFDAHWHDPLGMMRLSLPGYAHLTRELIKMAEELCVGKIVFLMEGGYDLKAVAHGVRNIAHALLGDDDISDPYGLPPNAARDVESIIAGVKRVHRL